jgi:hypothetical protein
VTVAISRDVHQKLKLLSAVEGLTVAELVQVACELLCDTYAEPVPAPVAQVDATQTLERLDAVVAAAADVVVKRGPGRPRHVLPRDTSGDRCRTCDHTRGEHCLYGEDGRCLSARCVCAGFSE